MSADRCTCGHLVGDHRVVPGRGLRLLIGVCLTGCGCTEFVLDDQPEPAMASGGELKKEQ